MVSETVASALTAAAAKTFGMRIQPDLVLERELWAKGVTAVAGVDEVGV
ncbi:MAG: hypothetical protein ACLQBA_12895 [Candidatus Binataceae bacterium]